jgi:serine protease Do
MTVGVISALGRSIATQPELNKDYTGLIQTDAAINPGNSGGPLVDINGKVIGINVAIFSTSGGYQGVGFAIPINRAKENIPDLAQGKRIQYGWIGVRIQDLDEQLSKFFKVPDTNGVLVIEVVKDSPASAAGLKERDVITAFNAVKINNVQQLVSSISHSKVGSSAKISVTRDGKPITLTINIAARPEEAAKQIQKAQPKTQEGLTKQWRGIEVCEITPEISKQYDIEESAGVIVCRLDTGSLAYNAGLRIGDVIEQINRVQINGLQDFSDVVGSLKGDALVRTTRGYTIVKEENSAP